jgi:hypothetical protein
MNFPTSEQSFQSINNGLMDAYIIEFNKNGTDHFYSSLIGGIQDDYAHELMFDHQHNIIISGSTNSSDFPINGSSYDDSYGGDMDGFLLKIDTEPPVFGGNNSDKRAFTGDPFALSIEVSDNSGVDEVLVEFRFDSGESIFRRMTKKGTYEALLQISNNANIIEYRFIAYDLSRNSKTTSWCQVDVEDNDPPILLIDQSPTNGTTGDWYKWNVTVIDNIGLGTVRVEYWYGINGSHNNVNLIGTVTFTTSIRLPLNSIQSIFYQISAWDLNGNHVNQTSKEVIISDNDPPFILADHSDREGTTGDPFSFSLEISDNIGVATVWIEYWYEAGDWKRVQIPANGQYHHTIIIPSDLLTFLHYRIISVDEASNLLETAIATVDIIDNDPPMFVNDFSDDVATTGDAFKFGIYVIDNGWLESIEVEYWMNDGEHRIGEISQGNGSVTTVDITHNASGNLTYFFRAIDMSDNLAISVSRTVPIIDNDPPIFSEDRSDKKATTGDHFSFRISATDNYAVADMRLIFKTRDSDAQNISIRNGNYTIVLPSDSLSPFTYNFYVVDISGNWNLTQGMVVDVIDNDPPYASVHYNETVVEGDEILLNGSTSWDNIGIVEWIWNVSSDDGFIVYYGERVSILFQDDDQYSVNLIVKDQAGLSDSGTIFIVVEPKDEPPDTVIWRNTIWIIILFVIVSCSILLSVYVNYSRSLDKD